MTQCLMSFLLKVLSCLDISEGGAEFGLTAAGFSVVITACSTFRPLNQTNWTDPGGKGRAPGWEPRSPIVYLRLLLANVWVQEDRMDEMRRKLAK